MKSTRRGRSVVCAGLIAAAALVPREARAVDPFEIQVYDGTANDPGQPGIELHTNHVASGVRDVAPPELAPHRQTHMTLEPSIGVTRSWELGGYFQTTLRGDGHFDYSGVKLRSKLVTPPDWHPHVRLGLNIELAFLPEAYDPDRVGSELRPIAAWESDDWLFAINPIVGVAFAGEGLRAGPSFEPALMAVRKIANVVSVGVEYYADFGPIADPEPLRSQAHYLYEVVNLLAVPDLELNVGLGEGLTPASNGFVIKTIVGYSF
jgi:hypothetical protein